MNFKAYDILSSLVPGFLFVLVLLDYYSLDFNNNYVVGYTAVAFLLGYIMNTVSSWLEDLYFLTWGGKPSSRLLDNKDIWKVRFYHGLKVKGLLQSEPTASANSKNDELFSIAVRHANGNGRVDDFNAMYAFSRVLLTTVLIGGGIMLKTKYADLTFIRRTL